MHFLIITILYGINFSPELINSLLLKTKLRKQINIQLMQHYAWQTMFLDTENQYALIHFTPQSVILISPKILHTKEHSSLLNPYMMHVCAKDMFQRAKVYVKFPKAILVKGYAQGKNTITNSYKICTKDMLILLSRYCNPNQKLACFVLSFKIINTFIGKNAP